MGGCGWWGSLKWSTLGQKKVLQHVSFLYPISPDDLYLYSVPQEATLERNRRNRFIAGRTQGWENSTWTGRLKLLVSKGTCQTQDSQPCLDLLFGSGGSGLAGLKRWPLLPSPTLSSSFPQDGNGNNPGRGPAPGDLVLTPSGWGSWLRMNSIYMRWIHVKCSLLQPLI